MFDRTPVRGGTIRAHHGQKPAGHTPQTPKAPDPEELMSLVPDSRFKNQGVFGKFDSPVKAGQPANFPAPPEARRPVEPCDLVENLPSVHNVSSEPDGRLSTRADSSANLLQKRFPFTSLSKLSVRRAFLPWMMARCSLRRLLTSTTSLPTLNCRSAHMCYCMTKPNQPC
ncbi:TPA: hypothetical protein ACH3X2_008171 [Trebouxia sp. C0005]